MSTKPPLVSLNSVEFLRARELFRARIDSLDHDTKRCFWPISEPGAPGPAFFPPVMYCFATLDYFSSFWAGWNDLRHRPSGHSCNQTDRMSAFSERYLLYPQKESQIAIHFWRHKLMHTAEPRALLLRDPAIKESYIWSTGTSRENHMRLVGTDEPNKFVLHFSHSYSCSTYVKGSLGQLATFQTFEAIWISSPGIERVSPSLRVTILP
jgi:hypothetical protein